MSSASDGVAHSEAPVFFEAGGETLFGIVSEPATSGDVGVLLVSPGGQGPSTGRNRTFVRMSRRLAAEGFHVLRFDYRGAGESTGSVELFRLDRPFTEDLRGAISALRMRGIERYVLVGKCFGARTVVAAAAHLPGLEAVVLISLPVRDREKDEFGTRPLVPDRTIWQYARRAVRPRVLRDMLRRQRRGTYLRIAKAAWRSRSTRGGEPGDGEQRWISPPLLADLEAIVHRRIPMLLLFGKEDPTCHDFEQAMSRRLGEIIHADKAFVSLEIWEGRVNFFTDATVQDRVIDLTSAWVVERVPVSSSSHLGTPPIIRQASDSSGTDFVQTMRGSSGLRFKRSRH